MVVDAGSGGIGVEVGDVVGGELGLGVAFEFSGVFGGPEVDLGEGVGGDRRFEFGGLELSEVLVRQHQGHAVGAGAGEEVFQGVGHVQELLGFVEVERRVRALVLR
jgi:hypothetical protein